MEDDSNSRKKSEMNRLASPLKDGSFWSSPSKRPTRNNKYVAATSASASATATATATADTADTAVTAVTAVTANGHGDNDIDNDNDNDKDVINDDDDIPNPKRRRCITTTTTHNNDFLNNTTTSETGTTGTIVINPYLKKKQVTIDKNKNNNNNSNSNSNSNSNNKKIQKDINTAKTKYSPNKPSDTPNNKLNGTIDSGYATVDPVARAQIATRALLREATIRGRESALKVFYKFLSDMNMKFVEDLNAAKGDEGLRTEIVLECILNFFFWLKDTAIQAQGKKKALGDTTISQYFGQIKETIKDATLDLKLWDNHVDEWYSALLKSVKQAYSSNVLEGEESNRDPSARAIPLKCTPGYLLQQQQEWLDAKGADLQSVIRQLLATEFNNPECHEERIMLLISFFILTRGGELKFLRHDNNQWDYHAHCLQGVQTRIKTRSQQPFWVQCAPYGNFLIDFLHAFASWACAGDGLFRVNPDKKASDRNFWFPFMRTHKNERIAAILTTLLRKYTAPCLKPHTSSRYLRVGPNTDLAMNKDISDEEQRQASGHSGGTSTELYIRMNRDLGVPVSLALALWDDVRSVVTPPTLDALDLSQEDVELLLDELYIVSLDIYKKHGKMRVLLRHGTASLIMYHNAYVTQYSDKYKLPQALIKSIVSLKWAADERAASCKLEEWAAIIKTRFVTENNLLPKSATDATVVQTLNNQSVMINQMIIDRQSEKSENSALLREVQDLRDGMHKKECEQQRFNLTISNQQNLIINLLQQLQHVQVPPSSQRGLFNGTSLLQDESPVSRRLTLDPTSVAAAAASDSAPAADVLALAEAAAGSNSIAIPWHLFKEHIQEYVPKDDLNDLLNWNDMGTNTSTKGLYVREVILKMITERRVEKQKKFENSTRPSWIDPKNNGHFRGMLKLVDRVISSEEKQLLTSTKKELGEIENKDKIIRCMLKTIELRAFDTMKELDNKEGNQTRKTMTGLGGRYKDWLKNNGVLSLSQARIDFSTSTAPPLSQARIDFSTSTAPPLS